MATNLALQLQVIEPDTDGIMAYYREDANKRVLVVANFGSKEAQIRLDGSVKKVHMV